MGEPTHGWLTVAAALFSFQIGGQLVLQPQSAIFASLERCAEIVMDTIHPPY